MYFKKLFGEELPVNNKVQQELKENFWDTWDNKIKILHQGNCHISRGTTNVEDLCPSCIYVAAIEQIRRDIEENSKKYG